MATNISNKDERNQLNAALWAQPWYQEWFAAQGINKGGKVELSDKQRKELQALVVQNGFLDPSDGHIDPAGNVSDFHGWKGLPTAAKIAIGAGVTAATLGAAGAFTGTAAPTLIGSTPLSTSVAGYGVAPSLIGSTAAGAGSMAGMGGTAAAITGATGAAGTGLSTMGRIGQLASGVGKAVGAATEASAQRQADQVRNDFTANAQNISGESAFQNQQQSMAQLEAQQQEAARKNLYRASVMKNPTVSPENRSGAPTFSPEMLEGMTNLEKAALARTGTTQYSTAQMRAPREYTPLDPKTMPGGASGTSTMQTIGNWLAPTLSTVDMISNLYRGR